MLELGAVIDRWAGLFDQGGAPDAADELKGLFDGLRDRNPPIAGRFDGTLEREIAAVRHS